MQYSVDVILLTYKPAKPVLRLIKALEEQTYPVRKIIIMNTEERYFYSLFYGTGFLEKYRNIEVHHLSEKEFDHGRTRAKGVQYSKADAFVCMTQDAIPEDALLLEKLLEPLLSGEAAVSYARQLPKPGCSPVECFIKGFNYPETSCLKGQEDMEELGIKTFFCSNACAAYDRGVFDELGGFIRHTIFNEDMIYAAGVIKSGRKIAYAAQAQVLHSHNYSWLENFHRNFDLGVSQADHPEVFKGIRSETEGVKMIRQMTGYLKETGNGRLILPMLWGSGWKFLGYRLGKLHTWLPKSFVKRCSMNRKYWQ